MVPKLHAKGASFKGLAAYLLHDKDRADTDERVAWTEVRNLAVDDPDVAWRVMAATAMDQDRLKASAGVKNTGRKSEKHVLHLTLSWHPEQQPTHPEMRDAADGAIAALGAGDRQAMLVAHNDEDHAHLHVVINRVSPADGRHLSSSKEKLMLSQWAQAYEERTGVYCENRIINNEARKRGEYVRGDKGVARHIYEAQQAAVANDNTRANAAQERVKAEQKAKDYALSLRGRNLAAMQKRAWAQLETTHAKRKAALGRDLQRRTAAAVKAVRERYRPDWQTLNQRQRAEKQTFDALEQSLFGRASNMAKTIRATAADVSEGRTAIISRAFAIVTNAGERKAYFERAQARERAALQRRQDQSAAEAKRDARSEHAEKLDAARATFARERADLVKVQEADRQKLQTAWKQRSAEREAAFKRVAELEPREPEMRSGKPKPQSGTEMDRRIDAAMKRFNELGDPDRTREQDNSRDDDYDRDGD